MSSEYTGYQEIHILGIEWDKKAIKEQLCKTSNNWKVCENHLKIYNSLLNCAKCVSFMHQVHSRLWGIFGDSMCHSTTI